MAEEHFDCAIIGGGIAGLTLSILLAKQGYKVVLFEKEKYPYHKVCGEYISNESLPFLGSLGLDLKALSLPNITDLHISSSNGTDLHRPLAIGGTGISRYTLDNELYQLALKSGASVKTQTKVEQFVWAEDHYQITTNNESITSKVAVGAYGKNSNIDVQLGSNYKNKNKKDIYIAVKHHIKMDYDRSAVGMHSFPGGYCGISAIEDDKINMSYIAKASHLREFGGIKAMEKNLLSKNPILKRYFDQAAFCFDKPLTISHLHFQIKKPVNGELLQIGDSAGNIAPLSGNGMSIAMRSSKIASTLIAEHLKHNTSRQKVLINYEQEYKKIFKGRIRQAKQIQFLLSNPNLSNLGFPILRKIPWLLDYMSKQIHGKEY